MPTVDEIAVIKDRNELKQRLEGVDRAMARIERWHNRLVGENDIVKQTLETVFRIFRDEVVREQAVEKGEEGEEFSETAIKAIREREEERQEKILEETK